MDGTAICIRCLDGMKTEEIATAIPAAPSPSLQRARRILRANGRLVLIFPLAGKFPY